MRNALLTLVATCTIGIGAFAPPAAADFLNKRERASGTVTACSKYGRFGCYTARLQPGKFGPQMRLKHGTVIDCEGDCRDTLRRATIDFWDDLQERSGSDN